MSLIDDALKRAQRQSPTASPPSPPYQPPLAPRGQSGQSPKRWFGIIVIVMLLVIIVWMNLPRKPLPYEGPKKPAASPTAADSVTSPAASPEEKKPSLFEILSREPEKIGEKTETTTLVTPPTEPPTPAEPVMPKLRLDGLILSPSKGNQAMINGVPVRVGDTISGATVQEIDKEHVKLSFQDKDIFLSIP